MLKHYKKNKLLVRSYPNLYKVNWHYSSCVLSSASECRRESKSRTFSDFPIHQILRHICLHLVLLWKISTPFRASAAPGFVHGRSIMIRIMQAVFFLLVICALVSESQGKEHFSLSIFQFQTLHYVKCFDRSQIILLKTSNLIALAK